MRGISTHGSQQSMLTGNGLVTGTEQEEGTRSIRALGFTRVQALVTDKGSLLVSRQTRDRYTLQGTMRDVAVDFRRGYHLW